MSTAIKNVKTLSSWQGL